jgi:hypothetical protein
MNKRLGYIEVLLKSGLNVKKRDILLISISNAGKELALEIEKKAKELGLEDIYIFYNDISSEKNRIADYIEKRAKFLFFTEENKDNLNMRMVNDILNNDMGIDYTVAVLPSNNFINEDDLYYYSSISEKDAVIEWNKKISTNNKIISKIKNFNLNTLKVENLLDTELTMRLSSEIAGNSEYGKMRLFPNYKVEIIPEKDSVNGFIAATIPTTIGTTTVDELRLSIRNGKVIDYDCASNNDEIKKVLDTNFTPVVEAIGLIDKEETTYRKYGRFNNIVLDRTSNPYVLISSYDSINDERNYLYVPIGTGSLKVTGSNETGKNIYIYEEEGFSKKIMSIKK